MPTYCYRRLVDGERREFTLSLEEKEAREYPDKSIYYEGYFWERDWEAEHSGFKDLPGIYPMFSDAAAVHPSQVEAVIAFGKKRGVNLEFAPDGRAIFRDRMHRRASCEARGLADNDGGYRDPQYRNRGES
jgi:hypothetical protein